MLNLEALEMLENLRFPSRPNCRRHDEEIDYVEEKKKFREDPNYGKNGYEIVQDRITGCFFWRAKK